MKDAFVTFSLVFLGMGGMRFLNIENGWTESIIIGLVAGLIVKILTKNA